MLELGVIADDLTGGMMVASLLEREGVRCPLVTSVEGLAGLEDDAEAVVIGRKIRLLPADEAVADAHRSAQGLLAKQTKRIYYKYSALFMSTDKGNIGPVSEDLMALTGADHVLFCPTWAGCTVYLGRLFVNDIMLHECGASRDPATPMTNSNLIEVLQAQSEVKTGLLPLRVLRRGKSAATAFLCEQISDGTAFFIADAIDEGDVERIAELASISRISTGADFLPIYLARHWQQGQQRNEPLTLLPPAPGYNAVLAGSCSQKTIRQLRVFEQHHPLYRVDLLEAANNASLIDEIVEWAADKLNEGPVGIATTADHEGVERAQKVLGRRGAADLAERLLGGLTTRLYELGVRKFVIAGGETSGTVIDTLGIDRLQVSSFDHLGGGYCHATGTEPMSLVTKAGGAGQADFFEAALERMQAADAAGQNN
ncbi:MAG: four-carbon acid sugar kinase family protein [Proteobacteria bacterium]|nr:four-carbon acid sugar kinase family protein [Pseudomonadota bacterium]